MQNSSIWSCNQHIKSHYFTRKNILGCMTFLESFFRTPSFRKTCGQDREDSGLLFVSFKFESVSLRVKHNHAVYNYHCNNRDKLRDTIAGSVYAGLTSRTYTFSGAVLTLVRYICGSLLHLVRVLVQPKQNFWPHLICSLCRLLISLK